MYEIMIQLYQKIRQLNVLRLFLENPHNNYYLRESARLLKMDPMTVKRALDILVSDGILLRTKEKNQILCRTLNMANVASFLSTLFVIQQRICFGTKKAGSQHPLSVRNTTVFN